MALRLTRNTWEGGLNTDVSKAKLDPIFYTEAHNLDSVADGDFFALKNIRGTTKVEDLISTPNTEVLGVFATKYLIGGENKQCLTIFTATEDGDFKIWCYDTESDTTYALYKEAIDDDYLTDDRVVDAVAYAENNIDHIYFTDDYNNIRFLRCEIPSPYSANFLSEAQITVQRMGANGFVRLDTVDEGGSLLAGSYQYAYRMVDPENKRFTKWSSLSVPFHVYNNDSAPFSYADYGLPTNKKIRIDIQITNNEYNNYSHFQVAVVENVYPTGPETVVEGQNQTFIASLLPIEAVEDYDIFGESKPLPTQKIFINNYEHKTNAKVGIVPIEELVVDLAAIKNVKSLRVKEKRLIGANVDYVDLVFDNGEPEVTSGSVITNTEFYADDESSDKVGYFRDEVYRYGIVYRDKYGNKAPVKVLNLNHLTGNQISGSIPDFRFPSRSTSNDWALFDSDDNIVRLGLQLADIKNHPSWAVGFEIVRAKRIKKILSQTPVIPMMSVQGIGALDGYPSAAVSIAGGAADNEYSNAQPQTSSEIFVPKNLFWPDPREIRANATSSGSGVSHSKRGEAEIVRVSSGSPLAMIFPQSFMYTNNPLQFDGTEKLETVDYCALRAAITDYSGVSNAGDGVETKIKGTFYALDGGDYYFDPAWSGKSISDIQKIKRAVSFDNLGEPGSLGSYRIMDHESLSTEGVGYGVSPNIQKGVVIETPTASHDLMSTTKTFANAGTLHAAASGVTLFSSGSIFYQSNTAVNNNYINEYPNYVNKSSYVQALKIANIVNSYEDDRYGDVDTQHEFISTGAHWVFTASELASVRAKEELTVTVDVWGGDCFVSPHTFKIADGAYSVVNSFKGNTPPSADSSSNLIDKWGKYFINTSGAAISLPVGVNAAAQYVTVVLESEFNGVLAQDVFIDDSILNNMPIPVPYGGNNLRSPLTYRYNINLSKQNDEKVYFPRPDHHFERNEFPARTVYSDQKIYNTDAVGFDIFRVLNFLDLEEQYGEITSLAIEHDNLYAIQERGIVALPVGETQVTTTDAGQLSVGISDFFGRPIVVNNKRGSQHLRAIVETGDAVYIPDVANKAVYALVGNKTQSISDLNNATLFRGLFSTTPTERDLHGFYDAERHQYWIVGSDFCHIFNEAQGQWRGNLEFPTSALKGAATTNLNLYLVGKVGDQVSLFTMYTGDANDLMGTVVTPRVTFVVNPDDPITKKFTNQAYIATERLATADFVVEREQELADQTISGTIIAVSPIGASYRTKLPRAAGNERLRGLRMIVTVKWKTGNLYSSLSQVLTKYQFESRVPF